MRVMIPATFDYESTTQGKEYPKTEWCRFNADGTIYVHWETVDHIINEHLGDPFDMNWMYVHVVAKLLKASRDNFVEATMEHSEKVAHETAEQYNSKAHRDIGLLASIKY